MSQFRKKPVVVEASQWFKNGDHPLDYEKDVDNLFANVGSPAVYTAAYRCENNWEGDVVRYYRHPGVPGDKPCEQCGKPHQVHGWIDTLEQGHRVCPGDWIIMGVKGEMYPCKPDIFAATYEPAAAPPAPPAPLPGKENLALLQQAYDALDSMGGFGFTQKASKAMHELHAAITSAKEQTK